MSTNTRLAPGRACVWLSVTALLVVPQTAIGQSWERDVEFASTIDVVESAGRHETDTSLCRESVEAGCPSAACSHCCTCSGGCCGSRLSHSDEFSKRLAAMAKSLEARGLVYDVVVPQFYQGVTSGGVKQGFEYGGKVDQFFIFDSGKLGLWQGMTLTMHAETRYGQDVNVDAVGLAPVNLAMLYPKPNEHDTAITGFTFAQALNEDVQLTFGKFNALDLFYSLYPQTGRGVNGFMNASVVIPISIARVVPLSFMGAGALKLQGKQIQGGVLVFDTQNVTTTSGFEDLFDNGANILGFWRFFTDLGGLPGSHLLGGIWSTGEFTAFDPAGFVFVPGQGIVAERQSGAYTLLYSAEQRLWVDCCNKQREVTLLSLWGLSDQDTSPFGWSANVAIQAQGLSRARPQDSLGVGYFYTGLSDDFQELISPVLTLGDVHGVELYYNASVAKCLQLTADLQIVEPARVTNDTAVVFGLRATAAL